MISIFIVILICGDFQISVDIEDQQYPAVIYANDVYYCFWYDMRYYGPDRSVCAARIAPDGTVIDVDGKLIFRDRAYRLDAACDGSGFLVVVQNSC